jgi:hypothetical protein
MKTAVPLLLAVAFLGGALGCASEDVSTAQAIESAPQGDQSKGDNVRTNAPVVHDPQQVQPGGSYKIEPANPNDEKFRPDPRLGGGG